MGAIDLIERVRRRAHEIWEREGWPHGRALEHWLRAEAEIRDAVKRPSRAAKPAMKASKSTRKRAPAPRPSSTSSRKQPSKR
jgi:Protein of unknown function (DUF2934)